MKKSIKTVALDQPTQPKEPQEPPLIEQPKDPPESTEFERNRTKAISIDTSTKEAMLITSNKVEMTATPQLAYKIIRVVNHFIKHIIEHHNDDMSVSSDTIWFKKWKSVYPIIRSSRRSMIDNHRLLFDDYTTKDEDINTYSFMMALIEYVPHLKKCYDIQPINPKNHCDAKKSVYRKEHIGGIFSPRSLSSRSLVLEVFGKHFLNESYKKCLRKSNATIDFKFVV